MDTLNLIKSESSFNQDDWEMLVETIQQSYKIKRHVDFFRWQQEYVTRILPHDIMIAVWGDFSKKHLSYDVCSNIPGFHTGALLEAPGEVGNLMADLYQRWLNNNERWYVINNFSVDVDAGDELSPKVFSQKLSQMHSVLVYGVRDIRGSSDSIYVFFDQGEEFPNRRAMLGMLMPHVDSAMRRLECVVPGYEHQDEEDFEFSINGLTQREMEILHWVKMGKTNTEISMILGISPNTVKNHLKRVFSKLDVTSRAQAVAAYMQPAVN
ncbi:HTH-type quorum sensing-dependent transcriptional regulator RpaR [Methylophilaceae bacterium]|nr:HTH-type quorum sensing-dependent transcriptional regulator RpaR [Methylophilaceae bacterium]